MTICRFARWADPSFLALSHWWLKPSGKLDIPTLFADTSESWTIHGMFCFSAPQFASEQSLFAFQTYLQIFHGRRIHVRRFRSSVLGLICENCGDNSLETRTWFHDYRNVSSFRLCSRTKSFTLLTVAFLHNYTTSGWRGLQDHQRATSICPAFTDPGTASSCRAG